MLLAQEDRALQPGSCGGAGNCGAVAGAKQSQLRRTIPFSDRGSFAVVVLLQGQSRRQPRSPIHIRRRTCDAKSSSSGNDGEPARHLGHFQGTGQAGQMLGERGGRTDAPCGEGRNPILKNPWKYFASRCRRQVWFWLTPNETYRPGHWRLSLGHRSAEVGIRHQDLSKDADIGAVEGQSTWHGKWYFQQGRLNFLWHPHPLIYALAVLACGAPISVLATLCGDSRTGIVFRALARVFFHGDNALRLPFVPVSNDPGAGDDRAGCLRRDYVLVRRCLAAGPIAGRRLKGWRIVDPATSCLTL